MVQGFGPHERPPWPITAPSRPRPTNVTEDGLKPRGGGLPRLASESGGRCLAAGCGDGLVGLFEPVDTAGGVVVGILFGPVLLGSRLPAIWGSPAATATTTAAPAATPMARAVLRLRACRRTRWKAAGGGGSNSMSLLSQDSTGSW